MKEEFDPAQYPHLPASVVYRLAHLHEIGKASFGLASIGRDLLYASEETGESDGSKLEAVFTALMLINDAEPAREALEPPDHQR